jgi:hypothetical protein
MKSTKPMIFLMTYTAVLGAAVTVASLMLS